MLACGIMTTYLLKEINMLSRLCNKCNTTKNISEFYKNHKGKYGHSSICKVCKNKYLHDRIPTIPESIREKKRDYDRFKRYGVLKKEYDELYILQDGVCLVCGKPETGIYKSGKPILNLSVDHDHSSGLIRGLLCRTCNISIGNAKNNPDILRSAANYLDAFNDKNR